MERGRARRTGRRRRLGRAPPRLAPRDLASPPGRRRNASGATGGRRRGTRGGDRRRDGPSGPSAPCRRAADVEAEPPTLASPPPPSRLWCRGPLSASPRDRTRLSDSTHAHSFSRRGDEPRLRRSGSKSGPSPAASGPRRGERGVPCAPCRYLWLLRFLIDRASL